MKAKLVSQRMVAVLLVWALVVPLQARYNAKPRWSLFSVEQEIQAGKEYSAQVDKEMPLVKDSDINNYVARLGQRLAAKAPGNKYPYTFKVVNQKEINAFALPGGPVYINVGTIQAASNESELAGVMAHEIAHVVMRHGVNQASKQVWAQTSLGLLTGSLGNKGVAGQLAQLGIGFGVNSLFMKYSRDAEREADLVGADMLHDAGINPNGMVTFFRKLEAEGGARGPNFMSSHPNPGDRAGGVAREIATLGKRQYANDSSEFRSIKNKVADMKPLTAQEIAAQKKAGTAAGGETIGRSGDITPSSQSKTLDHNDYTLEYPANWDVYGDRSSTVTIAPKGGVAENAVAFGAIISGFETEQRNTSLEEATSQLLAQLRQSNPDLRQSGNADEFRLNGRQAKSVILNGPSPLKDAKGQVEKERDWLVVTQSPSGDFVYFVFISPEADFQNLYPTFNKMLRSAKLK